MHALCQFARFMVSSVAGLCGFILPGLVAVLAGTSSAAGQVLVYKLEISEGKGINYHAYQGGYFVAPLLGGTGSFLLTSDDGPRLFTQAEDSGRLFTAVKDEQKKAVMSASTRTGTASGAMLAYGEIDHALQVSGPTADLRVRVARTLGGTVLNSDDESELAEPNVDGSLGVAGISGLKLRLDEEQTRAANKAGRSIPQTLEQLKLELERAGYGDADEADDDDGNDEEEEPDEDETED